MPAPKNRTSDAIKRYQHITNNLRMITYVSLILGILAIIISAAALALAYTASHNAKYVTSAVTIAQQANTSTFGHRLAGIDQPLNATQLSVINNAPNSYFQQAALMYINGTIANPIYTASNKVTKFTVNNKTTVTYLGSITCIFCAENRWAMALALSRFGTFSNLYKGYSSLGDDDIPTLYWTQVNYSVSGDNIGNGYSSPYVSFILIEDTNPITGGFMLNTPAVMASNLAKIGNSTYISAFQRILNLSNNKTTAFQGTPYTIWGNYQFGGADAVVFGNTTPTTSPQIESQTHAQILSQLSNPTDQFALSEYAAADVYVAAICSSLSNSTRSTVSACSLPGLVQLQRQFK